MTEEERREIHELIATASGGNTSTAMILEEKVLAFETAKATDDTVYVLDRLSLLGLNDLRERIVARLLRDIAAHPDDHPPWIA